MADIPRFKLTHGQMAWAICQGKNPDTQTLDALRYLRQLGVPFTEDEQGVGSGNRLHYTFDHLVECALAIYAIRHGMKPGLAAQFLTEERKFVRDLAREQFRSVRDAEFKAAWVRSRGKTRPLQTEEQYLRLHENYAKRGAIKMMSLDEIMAFGGALGDMVERYPTRAYPLVPLKRVMLEAVAWAQEAPVTERGRPRRRSALIAQANRSFE